jgi:glycosyltransferase involved in cell wall biosynthesis
VNTPLITIGITCYNAESTIARAIDSALAQDWPHLEIIVVDDLSSDSSIRMIEQKIAQTDAKLRLIRNAENLGVAGASNRIIDAASGDFIAFFDDDDESLPARVRRQYETITAYEAQTGAARVACFTGGERLYPNGHRVALNPPGTAPVVPQGEIMADYLLFYERKPGIAYGGTPACALMARASTFRENGRFDPRLRRNHDIDFCVTLALRGGHFIGCAEPLLIQHATTGSDKAANAEYAAWRQMVEKHAGYLRQKNMYGYTKRWIRFRYLHFSGRPIRAALALLGILARYPARGAAHVLKTGPSRLIHEMKMRRA